ncbi:hypothetical protein G7A66_08770 [Altererythrobacter sp. SALINAS58]|uniref:hypothetical protein n=1 Tax=Alteripontixanthobacter muriae TaxID=2705546 RepID=UPI001575C42E|nr:hypothetical protein [Alteripontixanthobacter muriae]NTZ43183.1 hypothetical protein [Alteripontixanthobacter muriae]
MRKLITAAALASSALVLAACSPAAEDNAELVEQDAATEAAADTAIADQAVINPNEATVEQLISVEGVSPELAQAIVAGQPYESVITFNDRLVESSSQQEAQAILTNVFVPIDLNTASEEEIRLIPGMTDQMVHEFEEYRPYSDLGVFDREIGKYVDEAEVARLRRYVTL